MAGQGSLVGDGLFSIRSPVSALFAGATVTSITGALVTYFQTPGALTALGLSFGIGALVLFDEQVKRLVTRALLFVLNALTIFSVAVGLNTTGQWAVEPQIEPAAAIVGDTARGTEEPDPGGPFFRDWF